MNAKVAASREDRIAALLLAQAEGRIRRGDWYDPTDHEPSAGGLLQALGPDLKAPENCPHDVMPAWLAELVPCIDGNTSANEWPRLVGRFCALASRWHVLDAAAWRRCDHETRLAAIRHAEPFDRFGVVRPMIDLMVRPGAASVGTDTNMRRRIATSTRAARRADRMAAKAGLNEEAEEVRSRVMSAEESLFSRHPPAAVNLAPSASGESAHRAARHARSAAYAAWTAAWAGDPRRRVADVVAMSTWARSDRIDGLRDGWDILIAACFDAIESACERANARD